MAQLYSLVTGAAQAASPDDQLRLLNSFDTSEGNILTAATKALDRAASGSDLIVQAGVNFRNNIRQGDDTLTPLQFIYEAADCRFFYTPEMYARQEAIWERVYQWAWGDEDACIEGSSGRDSSENGTTYYGADLPDSAGNFFGGNNTIFPRDSLSLAAENGTQTSSGGSSSGTSTGSSGESSQDGGDDGNDGDSENGATVLFTSKAVGLATAFLMGYALIL
ncbi:hypothetical protein KC334_g16285 [Hortaea werneckii]|nr:hypothetical protein KC334_g16285 [Hortaea werneckii]